MLLHRVLSASDTFRQLITTMAKPKLKFSVLFLLYFLVFLHSCLFISRPENQALLNHLKLHLWAISIVPLFFSILIVNALIQFLLAPWSNTHLVAECLLLFACQSSCLILGSQIVQFYLGFQIFANLDCVFLNNIYELIRSAHHGPRIWIHYRNHLRCG